MAVLTRQQMRDLQSVTNVLKSIDAFYSWLIRQSSFVPADLRTRFVDVLPVVHDRLMGAIRQLDQIDGTNHPLWKSLDDAGLVGSPLHLKLAIGQKVAREASKRPARGKTGIMGKVLQPIFGWINTFLGSLAIVIPPLELAKEYKEGVELVIDHQQEGKPIPGRILNLR
jgi:hypothetical protein